MEMTLPKAVREQVEQADKLEKALTGEAVETTPEPQPEQKPAEAIAPQPEPAQPEPTADPREAEYAKLEQKYKSLQGMIQSFERKNSALQDQLQQALAALEDAKRSQEKPTQQEDSAVSDKDTEDYGTDMIDMIRRVSRSEFNQLVAALRKEIAPIQQRVEQVTEQVAMSEGERFWSRVAALVPDWATLDKDPAWIEWLDTSEEFAEDTYRELASKAIQAGKPEKIAALVKKYRGYTVEQIQKPSPAQSELQRQVAPSSSKASSAPTPAGKIWSKAEYEHVFDPRWTMSADPKVVAQKQAEADQAVAEGRVRWA